MKHFRIALFTGSYNHIRDGVSLTLNRLVEFLENNGFEVLVFAPTISEPALEHHGKLVEIPSVSIPGRAEYRFSVTLSGTAKEKLERFDPDIVHIATPDLLGLKALRWAVKNGKILVSSYHTHFPSYLKYYRVQLMEPLVRNYLRWFYGRCEQVYVPTSSMIDTLASNDFADNMKLWPRGVDTALFTPDRREDRWRQEQGFASDDVIVLFVSRLVWEKNLEIFADTVKAAAEKNSRIKPLVVGSGPAMEPFRKLLPEARFTGFLSGQELARAYANSDIFLFPSDTESFGNVTLEAMSSGLPCVVADAIGSKSLVDHDDNGYLVPVDDYNGFISAIHRLSSENELRILMGRKSRQKAETFSWEKINSMLLSYYQEAIHRNSNQDDR